MAVEVTAGAISHSLALLSDAGHMLTDAAAIGLSLIAARLARRRAKGSWTYGFKRVEILSAQANGVTLLVIAAFITYEAVRRLFVPPHVQADLILIVALIGVVNQPHRHLDPFQGQPSEPERRRQLPAHPHRPLRLHRHGDRRRDHPHHRLSACRRDPLAVGRGADDPLRHGSGQSERPRVPRGRTREPIGKTLVSQHGVVEVHDLHVWEVTSGFPALSAHILVSSECDCHAARREMANMLHDRFRIEHTTLQVDHEGSELLAISMPGAGERE